jgi:hypothetical protein
MKKNYFTKYPDPANRIEELRAFIRLRCFYSGIPCCFLFREMVGTEFQVFASIFVPRKGILNCFLFHGIVQN